MNATNDIISGSDVEVLAKGASISFVGKIGGRFIFAISQIVLARMLGPDLFGLYALGWATFRLVGSIAPLGLNSGVIRYGSRFWPQDKSRLKDVVVKSIVPSSISGLLAGALIFALAPLLEDLFNSPGLTAVLHGFAIAIPLFVIMRVCLAVTQVWQRMQYSAIAEDIGQPAVDLLLLIGVILLGGGLLATVGAAVISWAFAMVLAIFFVFKIFPDIFTTSRTKAVSYSEILIFSLPTAFAGTFTFLTSWADRLLLGIFATTADVGIYQALAQPALIIAIILRSLNAIFTPMIANLYQLGEIDRLKEMFKVSTKWGIYLSIPFFLFICFSSQEIMVGLFGAEYASGALPLVVLSIGQMVNVSSGAVGFVLVMTGYERLWLIISAFSFVLNALLNVLLVPKFGLMGASIATAIAISTLYMSSLFAVKRLVDLWPYDARYKKGLLAAALTAMALALVQLVSIENIWVSLIVNAFVATLVFVGLLWLLGLDAEDREFLALLLKRVRRSRA